MKKAFIPIVLGVMFLNFYPAKSNEPKPSANINGHKLYLDVADDLYSRAVGLMFVESLPPDNGMVFLFEQPQKVNFWMKNVKIPLDMLFISHNKIAKIYSSVPICKVENCPEYPSENEIDYVIETNAGFCNKHGIKAGQTVKLDDTITNLLSKIRN